MWLARPIHLPTGVPLLRSAVSICGLSPSIDKMSIHGDEIINKKPAEAGFVRELSGYFSISETTPVWSKYTR